MQFQHIQSSVIQLYSQFARKKGEELYDESKTYHIHPKNRAYVWDEKMEEKLLSSILEGYVIPPITCIVKPNDRREIIDGGNRMTVFTKIIDRMKENEKNGIKCSEEDKFKIYTYSITVTEIRNATSVQIGELFQRLNMNKKATDGQLYYMSSDESCLVLEAIAFMERYPIRERCINIFSDAFTRDDTKNRTMLANIVGIISGTLYGIQYIRPCFDKQLEHVENLSMPIDRELFIQRFEIILQIFESVIAEFPKIKPKQKRENIEIGIYIGPILYDMHQTQFTNNAEIMDIWKRYILNSYTNEDVKKIIKIRGHLNTNPDKLAKQSYLIHTFVKEDRICSDEELKTIKHISSSENREDEDDYEENA